jgi:hypothetical protein
MDSSLCAIAERVRSAFDADGGVFGDGLDGGVFVDDGLDGGDFSGGGVFGGGATMSVTEPACAALWGLDWSSGALASPAAGTAGAAAGASGAAAGASGAAAGTAGAAAGTAGAAAGTAGFEAGAAAGSEAGAADGVARAAAIGRKLAARWAAVVGRPMFATELVRHLPATAEAAKQFGASFSGLAAFARKAYDRQTQSFLAARQVYREYLAEELSEEAFLEKEIFTYVDDEDPGAFKARIEDDILDGDFYSVKMRARLSDVYRAGFGLAMHGDDVEHCFDIARISRATVSGDAANRIATSLNQEVESISLRVSEVYLDVLGRDPDEAEVRDEVQEFRRHVPKSFYTGSGGPIGDSPTIFDPAAEDLRFRLHRSLEFHDVLKRVIAEKTGVGGARNGAGGNRELFRALRTLLDRCGDSPEKLTEKGNPARSEAEWKVDWDTLTQNLPKNK